MKLQDNVTIILDEKFLYIIFLIAYLITHFAFLGIDVFVYIV